MKNTSLFSNSSKDEVASSPIIVAHRKGGLPPCDLGGAGSSVGYDRGHDGCLDGIVSDDSDLANASPEYPDSVPAAHPVTVDIVYR